MRVGRESRFIVSVQYEPLQPCWSGQPYFWANRAIAHACCWGVASLMYRGKSFRLNVSQVASSHPKPPKYFGPLTFQTGSSQWWTLIVSCMTRADTRGEVKAIVATNVMAANNLNSPLCSKDARVGWAE